MMRDEVVCALALARISGIGARKFRRIVDALGCAARAFEMSAAELASTCNISERDARAIEQFSGWDEVEVELIRCQKRGIDVIPLTSESYPRLLKLIPDAPPAIYVKGRLEPEDELAIAVVGTRSPTAYGRRTARRLAGALAGGGFTIVSGLAAGIDESAHKGALDAGGRTIAVLGSGMNNIYPARNTELAERIAERGALISELPPHIPPAPENFPKRNRIISGLALATVVVEAPHRSGALITAKYALEQGRELFAVPGNIDSRSSTGTNRLIQSGAYLADSAKTIAQVAVKAAENLLGVQTAGAARIPPDEGETAAGDAPPAELVELAESERKVLDAIGFNEPINIDDIIEKSGLASGEVLGIVIGLELKGLIEALPGMQYIRRR